MSVAAEDGLPEGWAVTSLRDVATMRLGKMLDAAKQKTGVQLPYLRNINVRWGEFDLTNLLTMTFNENELDEFTLRPGDVLICEGGEPGRSAVWREADTNLKFQKAIHRVRLGEGICPEWLVFQLKHDALTNQLEEYFTGSTIKHFTGVSLSRYRLLVPPLAEQRRIVAAVERVLVSVASAREKLERSRATLRRFRQAVLAAACSGSLTTEWREANPGTETGRDLVGRIAKVREEQPSEWRKFAGRSSKASEDGLEIESVDESELPDSWSVCDVEQVASVCLGGTPSRKVSEYWGGHIPWVSSGEVGNCRIGRTVESITQQGLDSSNAKVYPPGTVLIAMIGEGKTRGQSAILDIEACTNQNVAGLVIDSGLMVPEYVWYWALSLYAKHRSGGRGGNYPALNGQIVRRFRIPVSPVEEQREIVRRVSALFALADAIELRAKTALWRVESLTQTVLAKAFRGELVPTEAEIARRGERSYEPASELIARLKTSTNAETKRHRGRKASRRLDSARTFNFSEGDAV